METHRRDLAVGLVQDPRLVIALARRRYARLAACFQRAGRTVAWFREYLIVQQPIGVLVIDCLTHEKAAFRTARDFEGWQKNPGGIP